MKPHLASLVTLCEIAARRESARRNQMPPVGTSGAHLGSVKEASGAEKAAGNWQDLSGACCPDGI